MSKAADLAREKMLAAAKADMEANQNSTSTGVPSGDALDKERRALEQMGVYVDESADSLPPMPEMQMPVPPAPVIPEPMKPQGKEGKDKEEQKPKDPMDIIAALPGAPTKQQLMALKLEWPEILVLPLKDDEVYLYRYLNTAEWRTQIMTQEKLQQDDNAFKDAIVNRCLLWPQITPEKMGSKQAGLRDLLFEVIMKSSYFIDAEQAMGLVIRL